eukprot:5061433-Amphidinium_carterae.1
MPQAPGLLEKRHIYAFGFYHNSHLEVEQNEVDSSQSAERTWSHTLPLNKARLQFKLHFK